MPGRLDVLSQVLADERRVRHAQLAGVVRQRLVQILVEVELYTPHVRSMPTRGAPMRAYGASIDATVEWRLTNGIAGAGPVAVHG